MLLLLQHCPGVVIDSHVKDNASNLAEDLCVNGRLKKKVSTIVSKCIIKCHILQVMQYRIQQIRRG